MRWDEIRDAYYDGNYGTIEEYVKSIPMDSQELKNLLQRCVDEKLYTLLGILFELPEVHLRNEAIQFLTDDRNLNDDFINDLYVNLYGRSLLSSENNTTFNPESLSLQAAKPFTPQMDADRRIGNFLQSRREAYAQDLIKPSSPKMSSNL